MLSIKQSKFIKSLKIKKYRTKERCFIAEGKKNVLEAISANYTFKYLLVTTSFKQQHSELLQKYEDHLIDVDEKTLVAHGTFKSNQDCLAVLQMPEFEISGIDFQKDIVVLDGVGDPGNLGTIIRTMDWFGITNLVCSHDVADVFNPKVINSTMGSFTRVKVIYTNLEKFLQDVPLPKIGADLSGVNLSEWHPKEPVALVMGSESHGISKSISKLLTGKVTIPKKGKAESLNVAIATGILCNHLKRL